MQLCFYSCINYKVTLQFDGCKHSNFETPVLLVLCLFMFLCKSLCMFLDVCFSQDVGFFKLEWQVWHRCWHEGLMTHRSETIVHTLTAEQNISSHQLPCKHVLLYLQSKLSIKIVHQIIILQYDYLCVLLGRRPVTDMVHFFAWETLGLLLQCALGQECPISPVHVLNKHEWPVGDPSYISIHKGVS